ncbi:DUF2510 domain-containing protein [Williamsia sp. CHRR-6]|uniref:DUF2510 domain-containing protein n=1 Tax=Williamsia sp. CHRR-6 TaxID=2835871 RepID=UPI001BD97649|nr:DUF2510 domain-containing protein [Williamsia sp. CHRR-6]MBT0568279.1 DUF2510 domain-containing protein [Williamsia sp. CHRR-6]
MTLILLFLCAMVFAAVVAGVVVVAIKAAGRSTSSHPRPGVAVLPGWHPDPHDPRLTRWHDGTRWTERSRPIDSPRG